jgi:anthranilate synthase component 2
MGIIISPGPGRPENAGICVELIQQHNLNIPILGVCLGLQAITLAFGGKVIGADEIVHGKHELIFHSQQNIYKDLPKPFQAGRYHSLIADRQSLPEELLIESENSMGLIMGLRHKTLPIYGVQFHPESILTPEGNDLLKNFVHSCQS